MALEMASEMDTNLQKVEMKFDVTRNARLASITLSHDADLKNCHYITLGKGGRTTLKTQGTIPAMEDEAIEEEEQNALFSMTSLVSGVDRLMKDPMGMVKGGLRNFTEPGLSSYRQNTVSSPRSSPHIRNRKIRQKSTNSHAVHPMEAWTAGSEDRDTNDEAEEDVQLDDEVVQGGDEEKGQRSFTVTSFLVYLLEKAAVEDGTLLARADYEMYATWNVTPWLPLSSVASRLDECGSCCGCISSLLYRNGDNAFFQNHRFQLINWMIFCASAVLLSYNYFNSWALAAIMVALTIFATLTFILALDNVLAADILWSVQFVFEYYNMIGFIVCRTLAVDDDGLIRYLTVLVWACLQAVLLLMEAADVHPQLRGTMWGAYIAFLVIDGVKLNGSEALTSACGPVAVTTASSSLSNNLPDTKALMKTYLINILIYALFRRPKSVQPDVGAACESENDVAQRLERAEPVPILCAPGETSETGDNRGGHCGKGEAPKFVYVELFRACGGG